MTTSLTPEDQGRVDRWIEIAHGSEWNDAAEEEAFNNKIKAFGA